MINSILPFGPPEEKFLGGRGRPCMGRGSPLYGEGELGATSVWGGIVIAHTIGDIGVKGVSCTH